MVHATTTYEVPDDLSTATVAITPASDRPTIIVRYLGYTCSHCVAQLLYLNSYAEKLKELGVQVVAISNDPLQKWNRLVEQYNLDTRVFRYTADTEGTLARVIKAQRVVNDTIYDLHATIVRVHGRITYATYSSDPDMDVARIVGATVPLEQQSPDAVDGSYLDRYLTRQPVSTVIAGPQHGVQEPLDLDFNRSYLHPNDLWVVCSDKRGHSMVIIHEATSKDPVIVRKKDSRASHFMWRTMAVSMGDNGAFATAQNGEPGDGDSEYMFMGPTLWSSDTSVFASRYQSDDNYLASHLDMLHQSPFDLGIAHDSGNIYWVSDAKYKGISRYDFRDHHEVGGTDHRDGVIRRYTETSLVPAERGRPAHIALDKRTGVLYYIDPGRGSVRCLDTKSGRISDTLVMPPSSAENVEEFTSVIDAAMWTVVDSLPRPVGIEIYGNRLLVGDEQTGRIHVFAIDGKTVRSLGYIQTTATSLHGIVVGPDERIWFVDKKAGTVCRLDLSQENSLSPERRVVVRKASDSVSFAYHNATLRAYQPAYKVRLWNASSGLWGEWSEKLFGPKIPSGMSEQITTSVSFTDTTSWYLVELAEVGDDGSIGLRSQVAVVPLNTRKVVVQDERSGTFDIYAAVAQTTRRGYSNIPSDLFVEIAHELPYLKTVLWNSATSGEISVVDDAVLRACISRKVDVLLTADDPLLLRTNLPQSTQFFSEFGVGMVGVQQVSNDDGKRIYAGTLADPISAGLASVECRLPRLTHHRGGQYLPAVLFRISGGGKPVLTETAGGNVLSARFERGTYRSVILGINTSRFLDGGQRTILIDKGLTWLEQAADPDTIFTSVTDDDREVSQSNDLDIDVRIYVYGRSLQWAFSRSDNQNMTIELYASTGQKVADMYSGQNNTASGSIDISALSSGSYHAIIRTDTDLMHRMIIVR